jgi:hypothetical protein
MAKQTLWSRMFGGSASQETVSNQLALHDIVDRYDVVEVVSRGVDHEPYILVSERGEKQLAVSTGDINFAEIGSSSPSPFTSFMRREYNTALLGDRGLRKYDEMRRSDGTVSSALRDLKTPVLAARWFVEPASDSVRDQNVADFVSKCLTEYMSTSWTQILSEALLMLDFGYYMFEKVWEPRIIKGKPYIVWRKLAPRHPMDVKEWHKDGHGGPRAVTMFGEMNVDTMFGRFPGVGPDVTIPIEKLLVFSFQQEAGNLEGISSLRPAFKHWYYIDQLYKIDAIQKERHGIGVPVIKLPMGFDDGDRAAADELGRNLRTNERAHVVLPPNWELLFAKLEGQPVDAMKSIEHHAARIRETALSKFAGDDVTTKKEDHYMFLKFARFVANLIADSFNVYAIPQLVDYNFQRIPNGYPKLRARGLGEDEDQRTASFTLRNLVGAGLITPDEKLEGHLRRQLDLPPADLTTRREIAQPQNPNDPGEEEGKKQSGQRAGLPRQTTAKSTGTGRANAGVDRSGGK